MIRLGVSIAVGLLLFCAALTLIAFLLVAWADFCRWAGRTLRRWWSG